MVLIIRAISFNEQTRDTEILGNVAPNSFRNFRGFHDAFERLVLINVSSCNGLYPVDMR